MFKSLKTLLMIMLLNQLANAVDQEDANQRYNPRFNNYQQGQFQSNFGGSSFVSSNDGNNVVVSRRMGPNQEVEDYISVSQPKIRIDGEYFSCSGLICPASAFKCIVTSETIAKDKQKMNTIAECMDKNGKVVERKEFTEKNPYPELQPLYSRFASVDREGVIRTEDSNGRNSVNYNGKPLTKEEEQEIVKNVNEQTNQINLQLQQQQQQFQQQMMEFQKNMKNAFGNGFPFGNNFPFYNPPFFQPNYQHNNNFNNVYD